MFWRTRIYVLTTQVLTSIFHVWRAIESLVIAFGKSIYCNLKCLSPLVLHNLISSVVIQCAFLEAWTSFWYVIYLSSSWYVSSRTYDRHIILGFPVSSSKCWNGPQVVTCYCVLLVQPSRSVIIKIAPRPLLWRPPNHFFHFTTSSSQNQNFAVCLKFLLLTVFTSFSPHQKDKRGNFLTK
jgi:hypothetical protein